MWSHAHQTSFSHQPTLLQKLGMGHSSLKKEGPKRGNFLICEDVTLGAWNGAWQQTSFITPLFVTHTRPNPSTVCEIFHTVTNYKLLQGQDVFRERTCSYLSPNKLLGLKAYTSVCNVFSNTQDKGNGNHRTEWTKSKTLLGWLCSNI